MRHREIVWKDFMGCAPCPAIGKGKGLLGAGDIAGRNIRGVLVYHQHNDPFSHRQINTSELRTALCPLGTP